MSDPKRTEEIWKFRKSAEAHQLIARLTNRLEVTLSFGSHYHSGECHGKCDKMETVRLGKEFLCDPNSLTFLDGALELLREYESCK